ncbi:MAG: GNAT family N-acetyltransferase [Acidobacteriota bacterium]
MIDEIRWTIEPFNSAMHKRDDFACGYAELDTYIRQYASQDAKKRIAQIFVALFDDDLTIKGYYTVSAASFRKEDLPTELAKRLPHYPVPAAILGRLAVDQTAQGQRLGEYLLMNAFDRIIQASRSIAIHAIIADAKDERVKAFYERYGFRAFKAQPLRMFISMATVEQLRSH